LHEPNLITATAQIVAAYVTRNSITSEALPELIKATHSTMVNLLNPPPTAEPVQEAHHPAVPIRKSITPDFLICLEDGKKFKSLKRHLRTHYNLTPAQYREKWKLPSDYPMVAPSYSAHRSELAKQHGLGTIR